MQRSSLQPAHARAPDPAERFLLWTIRAWVQCHRTRSLPVPVEQAWAEIGLPEPAGMLDAALRGVARATRRPLVIHCPHCPDLSDDEDMLLGAAAAVQHRRFDAARDFLGNIVSGPHTDRIIAALDDLGLMLALAGIDLPFGRESAPRHPRGAREPAIFASTIH